MVKRVVNSIKMIEDDRNDHLERLQAYKGMAELYDGTHSHISPIRARFADNGTVKYVVLSDNDQRNILYLQGDMVEELYKQWKQKLGEKE